MKTHLQNLRGAAMSRRTFVVAAGGAAVAAALPTSGAADLALEPGRSEEAWHVDDMFVGFPRYAQPIGFAPPRTATLSVRAEPMDYLFLV